MSVLENDLSLLGNKSRQFIASEHRMLIGGEAIRAESGATLAVVDPSSGIEIARIPNASVGDVDKAVKAARAAFDEGDWVKLKPSKRAGMILKLADLLEQNAEEFSEIESVNSGRMLMNTRLFDVDLSVDYLRYMAGWATKIHGKTVDVSTPYMPPDSEFFAYTRREPIGVVAAITPWNVPLGQAIWKIAPALATGCTIVLKPAELTSLTALRFGELVAEAGIPDGVINIVTGDGQVAGAALVEHPDIDKISFTGSTEVGKKIGVIAAQNFKKCTLELGGKSPVIVLEDADIDMAIPGAAWAIFGNHGQNCCAGSRLYVHSSIYEQVVSGVADIARKLKLGPSLDSTTEMGPLVSKKQQQRVVGYIDSAVTQGAQVLAGGEALGGPGCYVQPTVLGNVNETMNVCQEEIFGPVLVAMPFDDVNDVISRANGTKYGLGASLWTQDVNRIHRLIPQLKAGITWVNTHNVLDLAIPFGGVKDSGVGAELSEEAIKHHTQIKSTIMQI